MSVDLVNTAYFELINGDITVEECAEKYATKGTNDDFERLMGMMKAYEDNFDEPYDPLDDDFDAQKEEKEDLALEKEREEEYKEKERELDEDEQDYRTQDDEPDYEFNPMEIGFQCTNSGQLWLIVCTTCENELESAHCKTAIEEKLKGMKALKAKKCRHCDALLTE